MNTRRFGLSEHLLVAVGPSPNSAYLVQWTKRMAERMGSAWTAFHVETGSRLSGADMDSLRANLDLARRQGAEIISVAAEDVAQAVIDYARFRNVTQVIIGKSSFRPSGRIRLRRTLTERIIEKSGDIDVLIVQEKDAGYKRRFSPFGRFAAAPLSHYLTAFGIISAVTVLNLLALPYIGYRSVSIIYLLTITGLSFFLGRSVVIIAPAMSTLLWNFLFIPPRMTFTIGALEDVLMFITHFVTAFTIGYLTSKLKVSQNVLSIREGKMTLLYTFSQSLSEKRTMSESIETSIDYISRYFSSRVYLYLKQDSGGLDRSPKTSGEADAGAKAYEYALECFDSVSPCGRFTAVHPEARIHFVPLDSPGSVMGVIGIEPANDHAWTSDQEELLLTLGRNLALSLEREFLERERQKAMLVEESERLSKILLSTVSHELRTPLTAIKGSITALQDPVTAEDRQARSALINESVIAADKLDNIVGNLLSMNRLESGVLRLHRTWNSLDDLVGLALKTVGNLLGERPICFTGLDEMPPVHVDAVLFIQVISNILQNAAIYTPAEGVIRISACIYDGCLELSCRDSGPGVSKSEIPHLFDKFYRANGSPPGGSGLGLAICKGIVEAHGGHIRAENVPAGGLDVRIGLPDCLGEFDGTAESG